MIPILVTLTIFAVALLIVIVVIRKKWVPFEQEFPPISDEEFVARCTPGTSPEVALKVRRIVADFSGLPYERVHPPMNFIWDMD